MPPTGVSASSPAPTQNGAPSDLPLVRAASRRPAALSPSLGALLLLALLAPTAPAWVFRSASAPDSVALRIDPNVASRQDLMLLPRIGPALAEAILAHRASGVRFLRADDLDAVYRIGPATIERIRPFLRFDAPPADIPEGERP